jgi:hypothetical protein
MPYTTINKPSLYFNPILYTGTGATLSITGVGFKPDWVWIKGRSGATNHGLYDAVRGVQKDLVSNSSAAETTQTTGLTAFGSDGFTVGALAKLNTSAATYVSWNWLASNTTASNTSGTISSTVSANTTAGFSIVSYTGTGVNATVGHGLGVAPKMVIVKSRSIAQNWATYHVGLTSAAYRVTLDSTSAEASQPTIFNSTAPTSSVFSIGTNAETNSSGATYIAYCFAEIKGFSKFGKYTGNGSTDGTFTYTGFKPAFVLIKPSSIVGDWYLFDNKRIGYNDFNAQLYPNLSNAEAQDNKIDLFSNGFKIRSTGTSVNGSGTSYIYMAFAENPFVSSTLIPTTAR